MRWLMFVCVLLLTALPAVADSPLDGRAGRAEVRFLEGMIDHHMMAIDMAGHCLVHAQANDVRALCESIAAAQRAEVDQMTAWLLDWYGITYTPMSMLEMLPTTPTTPGHAGHGGHAGHAMPPAPVTDPPMMMGMMAGLTRLSGREYDIAWLEAMIDHHDDALHMSARILRQPVHPQTRALAEAILSAQTDEIARMEALIVTLSES